MLEDGRPFVACEFAQGEDLLEAVWYLIEFDGDGRIRRVTSVTKSCGSVVGLRFWGELLFCMGDGASVVELVTVGCNTKADACADVATAFL